MKPKPVTLTGQCVRLEPLDHRHGLDLLAAASFDEIWTYLDEPTPRTLTDIETFIEDALRDQAAGVRLPFATIDLSSERVVGSTSYIDIQPQHRSLEIGWTWLTPTAWGTGINTEAKYLLLRHAFEALHTVRVALKTDARNLRSQRAIERLGAKREGIWRNHRTLSTGALRDSVYFSITPEEWPEVKRRLTQLKRLDHYDPHRQK